MSIPMTRRRLVELLDLARGKRILVVGDVMLDVYLTGDVDRVSPEAPVPIVRVRTRMHALGGAANVAQNVTALGARCDLVAVVGGDSAGRAIREMLGALGAAVDGLVDVQRCTTQKSRIVARAQQLVRVDEEEDSDLPPAESERLLAAVGHVISSADVLVLEDYNKGVLTPGLIHAIMGLARERGIPIVVDPKYKNFFQFSGATIFKPNQRELEAALGAELDMEHPETLPVVLKRLGVAHLLLTLGERGMMLMSQDGTVLHVPTVAREVYDVVGAGDTVTAYLAAVLAAGGTPAEAALIANIAAGIEVGKLGAATVSADEILNYVASRALVE